MAEFKLTPSEVEDRITEAADVLGRLPSTTIQGYVNTWPPMVREYWESYGVAEVKLRRPPPSAAAIGRRHHSHGPVTRMAAVARPNRRPDRLASSQQ